MIIKRFLLLLLVAFSVQQATAQSEAKVKNPLQDYQYKKEYSLGVRLQSNGFSVYTQYGWIKDLKRSRHIQLEYNYFVNYAQKRQKPYITSNGREHATTKAEIEKLSEVFRCFRLVPKQFDRLVKNMREMMDRVRVQERIVMKNCVEYAKMPKKNFMKSFSGNENSTAWIDLA